MSTVYLKWSLLRGFLYCWKKLKVLEGQTLFVEILVIFLSWKLFLQIQAQKHFYFIYWRNIKETQKEIIISAPAVRFIITITSYQPPLLCQSGIIPEQIIFRFCQVFVPPSLTRTDLNILQSSSILSLPGPSIYSDKHLFFFYWMKV